MEVESEAAFQALLRRCQGEHRAGGKEVLLVADVHLPHSGHAQEQQMGDEELRRVRALPQAEREAHHRRMLEEVAHSFAGDTVAAHFCSADAGAVPLAAAGVQTLPACRLYRNGSAVAVAECAPAARALHECLRTALGGPATEATAEEGGGLVPFDALVEDVSLSRSSVVFSPSAAAAAQPPPAAGWQGVASGMAAPRSSGRLRALIAEFARRRGGGGGRGRRIAVLWFKAEWCGASRLQAPALALLAAYYSRAPGVLLAEVDVDLCRRFVLSGEGMAGAVLCRRGERREADSRQLRLPCFVCVEYGPDAAGAVHEESRVLSYDLAEVARRLHSFVTAAGWQPAAASVTVEEVAYDYEPPEEEEDEEKEAGAALLERPSAEVEAAVVHALAQLRRAEVRCSGCSASVASPECAGDPLLMVDGRLCHGSHLECGYCGGDFSRASLCGRGAAAKASPEREDESDTEREGESARAAEGDADEGWREAPLTVGLLPAAWDFRPAEGRGQALYHAVCLERARRLAFLRHSAASRLAEEQRAALPNRLPCFAYDRGLVVSATRTGDDTFAFAFIDEASGEKRVQEVRVRRVAAADQRPGIGSGAAAAAGDLQVFFRDGACSLLRCLESQTGGVVRLNEQRLRLDFNRAFLTRTWAPWRRPSTAEERQAQLQQLEKVVAREEEALAPVVIAFPVTAGERPLFDPGLREEGRIAGVGKWMKAALFAAVPAAMGAFLWSRGAKE